MCTITLTAFRTMDVNHTIFLCIKMSQRAYPHFLQALEPKQRRMHKKKQILLYAVGSPETRGLLVYQLQAECLVRKADISGP